jgi:hypothetical protein
MLRFYCLGFRVEILGFTVLQSWIDSGPHVNIGSGFRVKGLGFRI